MFAGDEIAFRQAGQILWILKRRSDNLNRFISFGTAFRQTGQVCRVGFETALRYLGQVFVGFETAFRNLRQVYGF